MKLFSADSASPWRTLQRQFSIGFEQQSDTISDPLKVDAQPPSGSLLPTNTALSELSETPLQRKLWATFLPAIALPLVIAGGLSGAVAYQRAADRATLQLEDRAVLAADLAHKELQGELSLLATVAANPLVLEAVRTGTQRAEVEGLLQLPVDVLETRFARTKLLQPNAALARYLQQVSKIGNFAEVFFTERHGLNVAYTQPTTDFVQQDETWWQQAKRQGQWVGEPQLDQSTNTLTIDLSYAIADPSSGEFLGAIKGGYRVTKLNELVAELQNLKLTGSEQLQILKLCKRGHDHRRDGKSGDRGAIVATIAAQGKAPSASILGGDTTLQKAQMLLQSTGSINTHQSAKVTSISFEHDQHRYTLANIPGTDWVVIAAADLMEIRTAGNHLASFFIMLFLGLGAVAAWMTLQLARQLSAQFAARDRTINQQMQLLQHSEVADRQRSR